MSNSRKKQESTSGILECLGCLASCLTACPEDSARAEERRADEAHHRGDHRDEAYHYRKLAEIEHRRGNHQAEAHARADARSAEREPTCSIM